MLLCKVNPKDGIGVVFNGDPGFGISLVTPVNYLGNYMLLLEVRHIQRKDLIDANSETLNAQRILQAKLASSFLLEITI